MSNRHLQIALTAATPGMMLSDPVLDTKGNTLLPAGTVLTAALLDSLARHQIDLLPIAAGDISAAEDTAERERRLARVARLFRAGGSFGAPDATGVTGASDGTDVTDGTNATETLRQYVLHFRSETAA